MREHAPAACRISTSVVYQLPKLRRRVRFPYPALNEVPRMPGMGVCGTVVLYLFLRFVLTLFTFVWYFIFEKSYRIM